MIYVIKNISKAICFTVTLLLTKTLFAQNTLSLEQCKQMALQSNKKISSVGYQISAARQRVIAAKVRSRPSFDGSFTGLYLSGPVGGPNGLLPHAVGSAGLSASQMLYNGNKTKNAVILAEQSVELSQINRTLTKAEILFEVERAYWQIVRIDQKVVLSRKYRRMLEGLKEDLQNSFEAGMIYKNDLLRVEVNLNRTILDVTRSKNELIVSKMNLAQLIGAPQDTTLIFSDSLHIDSRQVQKIHTDLADLDELKMLDKQLDMMHVQKKVIQGDKSPVIALSVNGVSSVGKNINPSDKTNAMAAYYGLLTLSVPIFDWGRRNSQINEQNFRIKAQQAERQQTAELINIQIQRAYHKLWESLSEIASSEQSLSQASENLRLTDDRHRSGTITGKDVLEAQALWQQAYSSLIDAKVDWKINNAAYRKISGQPDGTDKSPWQLID